MKLKAQPIHLAQAYARLTRSPAWKKTDNAGRSALYGKMLKAMK